MASGVESGKSLNEALEQYPKIFSHIFVSMVKVGELSGDLEKSLDYLAIQLEREADLKSKTKGAMIYPMVIISAMVLIGIVMAIFVLPKLTETFKQFGANLPLPTKIVVAISDFSSAHPFLLVGGLIAFIVAAVAGFRTPTGKRAFDAFLLRMPIINPIVKKINLARFARILSSLMKSGISIVEGLQVAADSMDNSYYRDVIAVTASNVKLGKPLTEALAQQERLFPVIVTQMMEVGEETGNIENILEQLAVSFEGEVDNTMRNLSSIIEPLLLLIIGVVVGFLALALISPIYNIGQTIQ
jgi:type IV pilus assembly protein PilC